jgi:hypothetical protein
MTDELKVTDFGSQENAIIAALAAPLMRKAAEAIACDTERESVKLVMMARAYKIGK